MQYKVGKVIMEENEYREHVRYNYLIWLYALTVLFGIALGIYVSPVLPYGMMKASIIFCVVCCLVITRAFQDELVVVLEYSLMVGLALLLAAPFLFLFW